LIVYDSLNYTDLRIKNMLCAEFSKYPEYQATPSEITLEMLAKLSEQDIMRMPNMGLSSLTVLKEELRKYNYYLR
jgi:DNA-directed RNA polymerase alpha subunit